MKPNHIVIGAWFVLGALAGIPWAANAATAAAQTRYVQECSACHIAYPPKMLPAESWKHLLGGLNQHFGNDASLDAATTREISDWLMAHGGGFRNDRERPPEDRITRSAWFVRQHGEIRPTVWRRAAVHGPSNCAACHREASDGHFSEDDVHIPK